MTKGFESIADEEAGDVIFKLCSGITKAHSSVGVSLSLLNLFSSIFILIIVCAWSAPIAAMLQSGMREERDKCIEITTEEPKYVKKVLPIQCYLF
jgi:hypothetical protein